VIRVCYYLLLIFFGAVIVHISVLMLIPTYVGHPVMERLYSQGAPWQFMALEDDNPIMVRQDPAFHLLVCYFDLREDLVHLSAEGNVQFWSLSLYDEDANNLYSLNSRVMPGGKLDLVIGDPIQIMDYKQDNKTEEKEDSILTQHNITEGFVILRAYVPSADWETAAETFLQSAQCDKVTS